MSTTDTPGHDCLCFLHLSTTHQAWAEVTTLSAELRQRLDRLDELHEGIDLERDGARVHHHHSGDPVPWMQQRLGEHVRAVRTAAERLRVAAEDMESAANDAGGMPRLAHVARGHLALVGEAQRVVASHRPERELAQVDWARVDGIVAGIARLEDLHSVELREEIGHLVHDHDQQQRDRRAAGLTVLADRIDADTPLQRALREMREFVSRRRSSGRRHTCEDRGIAFRAPEQ